MVSDKEKQSWTIFEPVACICIGAKTGLISTRGGPKPVFILDLIIESSGRTLVKFYNVKKTPKGSYSVKPDSDFAKLYRLTTGFNPVARYSRAHQLQKGLIGIKFTATYEIAYSSQDKQYYKVTNLKPLVPIVTEDWFLTGVLKPKIKSRKQKSPVINDSAENKPQIRNKLAKEQQNLGNKLVIKKAEDPHSNLVMNEVSTPLQGLASKIKPFQQSITVNNDLVQGKGEQKSFYYQQQDEETEAEYYYRVIDESRLLD